MRYLVSAGSSDAYNAGGAVISAPPTLQASKLPALTRYLISSGNSLKILLEGMYKRPKARGMVASLVYKLPRAKKSRKKTQYLG